MDTRVPDKVFEKFPTSGSFFQNLPCNLRKKFLVIHQSNKSFTTSFFYNYTPAPPLPSTLQPISLRRARGRQGAGGGNGRRGSIRGTHHLKIIFLFIFS